MVENGLAATKKALISLKGGEDVRNDARICQYLTEEGVEGIAKFIAYRNAPPERMIFLCTEYMGKTTLWHFLHSMEEKHLAIQCYYKIVHMMRAVATIMIKCHEKGVAHRDMAILFPCTNPGVWFGDATDPTVNVSCFRVGQP